MPVFPDDEQGRPPVLTMDKVDAIAKIIRDGNYAIVAAGASGICQKTYYVYIERGEKVKEALDNGTESETTLSKKDTLYLHFLQSIEKASHDAEMQNVKNIQTAARNNWQASAWYLERKFFDRWGRKELLTHAGKVEVETKLSKAETDRIREELAEILREDIARPSPALPDPEADPTAGLEGQ
jgi:hypothetical protein